MDEKQYRPDIDGLRAIAVLSVVAYHAGLPGVSGGYVGVDVFFVISGYLITRIIDNELRERRFSIIGFYERRCRRILPALFAVLALSLAAGYVILPPSDFEGLGKSAIATIGFGSNFYFLANIDYFSPSSEFLPLLHTWSLAVEEQFYIVFPLLLMALVRWRESRVFRVLIYGLIVLSLAMSVVMTDRWASAAFYMLPPRGWELLLGAVLALGLVPQFSHQGLRQVSALVGLALILVAVILFDDATPFPGFAALAPVLGSALLIHAGTGGTTQAGRLLALKPVVFVGLISYSLYLWHWPVLAFLRQMQGSVDLDPLMVVLALVLMFAGAILSWRYVERPFRNRQKIRRRSIFALSAVVGVLLLGAAASTVISDGMPERLDERSQMLWAGANDMEKNRKRCSGKVPGDPLCRLGEPLPATVLLWGDSHAGALMSAVEGALAVQGKGAWLATHGACPPLLGIRRLDAETWRSCVAFNEAVIAMLEQDRGEIDTVILAGRWAFTATGERMGDEAGGPGVLAPVDGAAPAGLDLAEANQELMRSGLGETVARLTDAGLRVIILGGVPEIGWHVPRRLTSWAWHGGDMPVAPTLDEVEQRNASADAILKDVAQDHDAVLVPLAPLLCQPECIVMDEGRPVYVDGHHLSLYGEEVILAPRLAPEL